MKRINIRKIAKEAGISYVALTSVLRGVRNVGGKVAKGLTRVTGESEGVFLRATPEEIKEILGRVK